MYRCIKPNPANKSFNAFLQEGPGFSHFLKQFIRRTTSLQFISVLLFLFTGNTIFCQAPNIEWQKSLGGSVSEFATSIQQTTDGGYIVAGGATSNDGDVSGNHSTGSYADCWIVKLGVLGNIQWQKCLGGSGLDRAHFIQQTTDGGYIVAGSSTSHDGDVIGNHSINNAEDYWIVKLDALGNIQWQKCLGGSGQDIANAMQQTTDGGYIVAGWTSSNDGDVSGKHGNNDYWIVKLDALGNIQWQKCLGGSLADEAWAVRQTTDGGYIVAGVSMSNDGDVSSNHGTDDYWIVKLDALGNTQWQKSLGGSDYDLVNSIQQTTDGGYIISGRTYSNNGDVSGLHGTGYADFWIVKLDALGNIQWQKCLGGSNYDFAYAVQQTMEGGYIVAGRSSSYDGDVSGQHNSQGPADWWIVKLDALGNIQWQKCLGGTDNEDAYAIQQTIDGGYIIAGRSSSSDGDVSGHHGTNGESDFWIVKLGGCPAVLVPQVNISSDAGTTICAGTNVTFTATATNGGATPAYQWKINGVNVGTNASTFNSSTLGNGDIITCDFTSNAVCVSPNSVTSPGITMTVTPGVPHTVNITSTATTICPGTGVIFTATTFNAGISPTYQWKVNGMNAGTNSPDYINENSTGNFEVVCIVTPAGNTCSPGGVSSNSISITVNSLPVITVHPADTLVKPGTQVQLNALINGNIRSFDWSPASGLTSTSILSPFTVSLNNSTDYWLHVVSADGCPVTKKVSVRIIKRLLMPNAFTPNDDGLNDVFRIPPDVFLTLKIFSIYNRWGERIFTTTDISHGWDGRINGVKQPSGIYVYYLNGSDDNGAVFLKGSFMLIR